MAFAVPCGRARTRPRDAHDEFVAQALSRRKNFPGVRIEYDLQQSRAVAQIDKDYAAVIAPTLHPAGDLDFMADVRLVDLTAVVGAHRETSRNGGGKGRAC